MDPLGDRPELSTDRHPGGAVASRPPCLVIQGSIENAKTKRSFTSARKQDLSYDSDELSEIDVGATQPETLDQDALDHTSHPEIDNNFSSPSRQKSPFLESTGDLTSSPAGDHAKLSARRTSTNDIMQPESTPYDFCITTKLPSVRPLPPEYAPTSKQEPYRPYYRTEEEVVNEQFAKLLKQTNGGVVDLEEDTPSRSYKPAFLPPPPEELTVEELIESISISGYWQMTAEKVTLLESFFSADKMQQMEEDVAGVKLDRSDVARIVQMALALVYLEKRLG
ncbi:hypothetical protein BKA80DRAFT_306216 [Phyllosticta citrichinensis]